MALEATPTTSVRRCSSRHLLYVPAARAAQQRPAALAKMSKRAELKSEESRLVERFLVVTAGHVPKER